MRRVLVILIIALLVSGIAVLAGCGEKKTTVETDNGTVEVTEKDGGETETTVTTEEVTEEEIGVPIYPGAKTDVESSGKVTTENEEGETSWAAAVLWTDDPIAKVIAWYKDQLIKKPGFTDMSTTGEGELMGLLMFRSGDTMKTVTIGEGDVEHPGVTVITISTGSGAEIPDMTE